MRSISQEDWRNLLEDKPIPQEGMNSLIMEFLASEGYGDAARLFALESGTPLSCDARSLRVRQELRSTLLRGDVLGALAVAESARPGAVAACPRLRFHIAQQRLIELVRRGRPVEALRLAREVLAPLAREDASFLRELEETVMLLAFNPEHLEGPSADLLSLKHRRHLAAELNDVLLGDDETFDMLNPGNPGSSRDRNERGINPDKKGGDDDKPLFQGGWTGRGLSRRRGGEEKGERAELNESSSAAPAANPSNPPPPSSVPNAASSSRPQTYAACPSSSASASMGNETRLSFLMKLLTWSQEQLKTIVEFPEYKPEEDVPDGVLFLEEVLSRRR
uniref:CTLH domain-containing protein n=1 Tax=Polytomella parva TaxID=51329 RepID=A0A7S0VA32_9CHLO|mmetsp:Transcript_28821/g.52936  ORF Transcript_28821/g.52936 Transcript_28821/m.52936 type:complete len:335 (+) Transcript_28821:194-1198(+)|eukprot:CAMPEP_0175058382 /NCGR_PEP_ID=MMETSP0052_2-20121109/11817_1 /TAXON_ID=51329 ORGANISM="Polytomella parva, Strain SAG 63-3" /NCGR_SAMPLE_ID=MMETSP0052_2 /ASSEMBLY_ACC=CAM_ASM_000194 /LENGTH=334 /DNA_ID=CAMNT_0016323757 /DNA_START=135 /DNA_END=1139 /DNA_ORIENTATION=-